MKNKSDKSFQPRPSAIGLAVALAFTSAVPAWALPTGEQVVAGQVSVGRPNAGNMVIQQGTSSAIVNWNSFSIGGSEVVRIQQPGASSVILNRVLGNSPSDIYGQLSANGKVFLVNPNGVLFGRSASVDVGSLVASTLSIRNEDFLAGRYTFTGAGGSVVNHGTITAAERGTVALLGGSVRNDGTIVATLGTTALASGGQITLDLAGDGLSKLTIAQAALDAEVANGGAIIADGGQVLLSARSLDALAASVINQTGSIRAQSLVERNGRIMLDGGDGGTTLVSGNLDATGAQAGSTGGEIQVLGHHVGVTGSATLDASGSAGGGSVLVGGDYQGKNAAVRNAQATFVGRDVTLRADATDNGNGGEIIAWSDEATRAYGTFSANGGANGGDGGLIETSGKYLDTAGARVFAAAPAGRSGQWLLDPIDITIQTGAAGSSSNAGAAPNFVSSASPSAIADEDIEAALNVGTSVTITTGAGGADLGDITIAENTVIEKTAGGDASLTLNAERTIRMLDGSSIVSTAGALDVNFNSRGPFQAITVSQSIVGGGIVMSGSSIFTNGGNVRFYGSDDPFAGRARGFSTSVNFGAGPVTSVLVPHGIQLNSATIDTCVGGSSGACGGGAGSISLRGQGAADSVQIAGVTNADGNSGVRIFNSQLRSGSGAIGVDGQGSPGGIGAETVGNSTITSQSGSVNFVGIGIGVNGTSTDDPLGLVVGATTIDTGGSITLSGTGGDISAQIATLLASPPANTLRTPTYGVLIDTASVTARAGATITISGQGANSGFATDGSGNVTNLDARDVQVGFTGGATLRSAGGTIGLTGNTFGVQANGSTIDVSNAGGAGGSVQIGGTDVGLVQTSVNADGSSAGGQIDVDADNVAFVAANASLSADATNSGNGGTISVRALAFGNTDAASTVRAYGTFSARAGATGGNGGTIETSGLSLDVAGIDVDASAPAGQAGTWLVDPIDVTISDGATSGGSIPDFVAGAPGANVQDADISNALNTGTSVSIRTNASPLVPDSGNLTMNAGAAINKTAGADATLTLNAHNNISILGNITSTSGALGIDLNSDSDGAGGGSISVGGFTPVSLLSNGGDIRFYGQDEPGTGRATSGSAGAPGISVVNATIDSRVGQNAAAASGDILMRGEGSQFQLLVGSGVSIEAATLAASTGLIELNGLGGTGADGVRVVAADPDFTGPAPFAASNITGGTGGVQLWGIGPAGFDLSGLPLANAGVYVGGGAVSVANGPLDVRGRADGPASTGVLLTDVAVGGTLASTVATTGANGGILLIGESTGAAAGVSVTTGASLGSAATQGNIVIRAANDGSGDAVALAGAVQGTGVLNLRPGGVSAAPQFDLVNAVATPISIGGAGTGFDLSATDLAALQPGFFSIVVGSDTHAGAITLASVATFADPLTLQNDGGAGGIAINAALSNAGRNLTLSSAGAIGQTAPITAAGLLVRGAPTSVVTLNNAANAVGTLSVDPPASFSFVNSGPLALGPLTTTGFVAASNTPQPINVANSTAAGNFQVQTLAGNLTLNQDVTTLNAGSNIDLATAALFVNSGAGTLTPGAGGVWRVWANTWVGETRGGLAPGNPLPNLYGCAFGNVGTCALSGVAIPATNHFLYVQRPTLVAGVGNIARTYGAANPPLNPTAPTGLLTALGDTLADALTGGFSTAATQTSPVGTYAINPPTASPAGYDLGGLTGGQLTINPAQLVYVANPVSRNQGVANPPFSGTVTGFVLGESVATATTGTLAFTSPTDASTPVGSHPINGSGLSAANYVLAQAPANATALTILPTTPTNPTDPTTPTNPTDPTTPTNPTDPTTPTNPTDPTTPTNPTEPQTPSSSVAVDPIASVLRNVPETSFVYDRNLGLPAMCGATGPALLDKATQGVDILSLEWSRVRQRPNLSNCVDLGERNGCSDF